MKKKPDKLKVRAIKRFFDRAEGKQREVGEEWSVTAERAEELKGKNELSLCVVEEMNADSTEKGVGADTLREESEEE